MSLRTAPTDVTRLFPDGRRTIEHLVPPGKLYQPVSFSSPSWAFVFFGAGCGRGFHTGKDAGSRRGPDIPDPVPGRSRFFFFLTPFTSVSSVSVFWFWEHGFMPISGRKSPFPATRLQWSLPSAAFWLTCWVPSPFGNPPGFQSRWLSRPYFF